MFTRWKIQWQKKELILLKSSRTKIALRAIDRNGLMVGREFDDYKSAVDMARDYWIKGFLYVEAFSLDGEKFVLHHHRVRTY